MTQKKLKLKVGDPVIVLAGKDRGTVSVVQSCLPTESKVVVKDVALMHHFVRPSAENPDGGVLRIERAIHISNVAYYDADKKKASKVGYKVEGKTKQRIARKTKAVIAEPQSAHAK